MKLSALLTWIVVATFAATTSATGSCTFTISENSGCSPDDVDEVVNLLNQKLKQQSKSKGNRGLNEEDQKESPTGLRGTQAQESRELPLICESWCLKGVEWNVYSCGGCRRRRKLAASTASSDTEDFGEMIKGNMRTFGWNGCKPNQDLTMICDDV